MIKINHVMVALSIIVMFMSIMIVISGLMRVNTWVDNLDSTLSGLEENTCQNKNHIDT